MSKYKPRSFLNEYARFRNWVDREYGERAYGDKFKVQSTSMTEQPEAEYDTGPKFDPMINQQFPRAEPKPQEEEEKLQSEKEVRELLESDDKFTEDEKLQAARELYEEFLEKVQIESEQKKEKLEKAEKAEW